MPLPSGIMQPSSGSGPPIHHRSIPTTTGGVGAAANSREPDGLMRSSSRNSNNNNTARSNNRRLWLCRLTIWVGVALAAYQVLWSYFLAGYNIPDVEIDKLTGQKRIRRRPDKLVKHDPVTHQDVPTSPFDGIMESHFTLMSIKVPNNGLKSTPTQKYSNVKATFCHIAWWKQDEDPSRVPMWQDLRDASPLCLGTRYSVDLWDITRQAVSYDGRNHTFAATNPAPGQGPVPPTAVVFHQTRCGSTLIANVLASFMPQHSRVYSEATAPLAALMACNDDDNKKKKCDAGAHEALIQDVFYMMGRSPGPTKPQYVFYKIQSIGTHAIDAFVRAMPDTPWIFAYRDPVEIMMSHFKNYQTGNPLGKDFMPNCLRNYGHRQQPVALQELVQKMSSPGRSIAGLSKEEYCAAHLASLGQAAIDEYEHGLLQDKEHRSVHKNKKKRAMTPRWFINYNELPYKIWETVLPAVVPFVSHAEIERMQQVGKRYSKGRGDMAGEHWHEDSTLKQGRAPELVKNAAKLFMDPVYEKLEAYRKETTGR